MKYKISIVLLLLLFEFYLTPVQAETVIYDNITTSQYKTLKVTSDLCINYLTDCQNEVYINGLFSGYSREGEVLQVPDGSDVRVVLEDPINTNLEKSYDTGKTSLMIAVMAFIGPIVIILIIYFLIMFTIRKYKRR